jgi:hypothetical protein
MKKLLVLLVCSVGLYAIWKPKLKKTKIPTNLFLPDNKIINPVNNIITPYNNPNNGAITIISSNSQSNIASSQSNIASSQSNIASSTPLEVQANNIKNGYDVNEANLYQEKYWELKPEFSDIYNYEDQGGLDITHALDKNPAVTVVFESAPKYKPTKVQDIKLESAGNILPFFDKKKKTALNNFIIPKKINDDGVVYNLLGYATNDHYDQRYVIYESSEITDPTNLKNTIPTLNENMQWMKTKIMSYVLVTFNNDIINIIHRIAPRNKIEIGDVVYLSMGTFELGPLNIKRLESN